MHDTCRLDVNPEQYAPIAATLQKCRNTELPPLDLSRRNRGSLPFTLSTPKQSSKSSLPSHFSVAQASRLSHQFKVEVFASFTTNITVIQFDRRLTFAAKACAYLPPSENLVLDSNLVQ